MRALTKPEAFEWYASHNIALNERQLPQPIFAEIQGLDFKIPQDAGRRIALLNNLFKHVPSDQEILLRFSDWGVWSSGERPHMFERFRDSYGEHRWLSEAPAYVFSPTEREDVISFVGFAILFLWDCYLVTATGDTGLFLSHDEIGWIYSRTHEFTADDLKSFRRTQTALP
jgi:hypothetical protein